MKRIYLIPLCATALSTIAFVGAAQAANEPAQAASPGAAVAGQGKLDRHDHEFLSQAAEINLKEIQIGKLAEQHSTDPNVKKIAGHLIKDHEEANKDLARLAASKGITLPSEPSMGDRRTLGSLEKEQGDKFNQEFLSLSTKGHEKAIALFEKESARTQDPDIKAWAQKMVPALKAHLAMSQSGPTEAVGEKQKKKHHSH